MIIAATTGVRARVWSIYSGHGRFLHKTPDILHGGYTGNMCLRSPMLAYYVLRNMDNTKHQKLSNHTTFEDHKMPKNRAKRSGTALSPRSSCTRSTTQQACAPCSAKVSHHTIHWLHCAGEHTFVANKQDKPHNGTYPRTRAPARTLCDVFMSSSTYGDAG